MQSRPIPDGFFGLKKAFTYRRRLKQERDGKRENFSRFHGIQASDKRWKKRECSIKGHTSLDVAKGIGIMLVVIGHSQIVMAEWKDMSRMIF